MLAVLVVLLGALGVRHVVASTRAAARVVPAPAQPVPAVVGATPSASYAQLAALDASAGHLLALTSAREPECSPVAPCRSAPTLSTFTVFDSSTGSPLAVTPLSGAATPADQSVALLADPAGHIAYAVAPDTVTLFSTVSGAATGGYSLPSPAWQRESGAAFDDQRGLLVLGGGTELLALDAATGQVRASRMLEPGTTVSALTLDPATGTVYALLRRANVAAPSLVVYDVATLAQRAMLPLPAGARLGPVDSATGRLYLPGASGGACVYTSGGDLLAPAPDGVCDALALGWNAVTGHVFTSAANGVTLRDAATGRSLAALPVRAAWPSERPLLVDGARGLLYVPDERGTILIVREGPALPALTSGGALLLARAALADLLPDTNQDPPFVAPDTFPATFGTRPQTYWIHFSDLGWQGPYAGAASSGTGPSPSGGAGGYTIMFTITWNQLFQRTHTWTCAVSPSGAVRLVSETGDAVP